MTLVRFTDHKTREAVYVNPEHVATVVEVPKSSQPASRIWILNAIVTFDVSGSVEETVALLTRR